jgi:hypothetical protein
MQVELNHDQVAALVAICIAVVIYAQNPVSSPHTKVAAKEAEKV